VVETARAIADVYRHNGRMLSMGNGGSSCDSAHFAVEFLHPITAGRPALTAVNLVNDAAMMTAVGNDVSFDHIFVRQVIAHGRAEDGLVGFSTSGNSANLVRAFDEASRRGMLTIGLAGYDGGTMAELDSIDYLFVAPSSSVHRIQEAQTTTYQVLWELSLAALVDLEDEGVVPHVPRNTR
ncbi:MAG: D-sedoheptulose-7-phosphate isomerase, partial [Trebonia sp.]